ncbi:MAG: DUF2461 domain-containing protein [Dysgonamonadaceae bacterium]
MKSPLEFTGFTPQTIQFLKELKENNYKEWFEEHRNIYETELLQPFKSLVESLTPAMFSIDPRFEFRPYKVVSRIYRDIRFSKDKSPYKKGLWLSFNRPTKEWTDIPGYYFELSAEHCQYGMGLFMPKRKVMDILREEIEFNTESFMDMLQPLLDKGFSVEGEMYAKPLKNNLVEEMQPWFQRKSLYFTKEISLTDPILYSEELSSKLTEDFTSSTALYRLMMDVADEAKG